MELKRKQEEVDRKKREEEEKVIQVWTVLNFSIVMHCCMFLLKKLQFPRTEV